jgi:large subunit ribosomal protein L9
MIEAILKKSISKVGRAGDIIKVKEGYFRNYLLPNALAVEATSNNIKAIKIQKEKELITKEIEKKDAFSLAEKMKGLSFNIKKEATDKDVLYGSVSASDIQKALSDEGYVVPEDSIIIKSPIKNLGIYEIELNLHPEVNAKLKVWVVKK